LVPLLLVSKDFQIVIRCASLVAVYPGGQNNASDFTLRQGSG
jgi:hypothetical protein